MPVTIKVDLFPQINKLVALTEMSFNNNETIH